jgi:dienelactone hydrolase
LESHRAGAPKEQRVGEATVTTSYSVFDEAVRIDPFDAPTGTLSGTLSVPETAWGAVLFAQGSGGSCECSYALTLAEALHDLGLATLLVDLYSSAEEHAAFTSKHRVDIGLMTDRLHLATDWIEQNFAQQNFKIGYVGAGAGAAAILKAAAERPDIPAAVSCDGLPILAGKALADVTAAVLLIVGQRDRAVVEWNAAAYERLAKAYRRELATIPNVSHPIEGPEAVQEASMLVARWFMRYLGAATVHREPREPVHWSTAKFRSLW